MDNKGKIKSWKAYANYCDGSCQIFLKDSKDITSLAKVQEILYKLKDDPASGIKKGVVLSSIDMIDEGPTMAQLLGLKLKDADGDPIDAILN